MKDTKKTKRHLIQELVALREKTARLEGLFPDRGTAAMSPPGEEQTYRGFFENASEGFFRSKPEGRFLDVNPAFAAMLGYGSPKELLSSITDIASQHYVDLRDRHCFMERMEGVGSVHDFEYKARRRDGSEIWMSVIARAVRDEGGRITSYEGIVQDITLKRQADEEIRRSEARLKSLVHILQYQTESIQDFLNYALNEAIGLTGSRIGYIYFYSEEKKEFTLNTWSREVMGECSIPKPPTVYQLEKTGIWGEAVRQRQAIVVNDFLAPHPLKRGYPEGHAHLHRFMTIPVFSGGAIVAVVGVANKESDYERIDELQLFLLMDAVWKVAEQKRSEEALRSQGAKIASIFRAAPVGIGVVVRRVFQEANDTLCRMTGYSREELLGRDARMLYLTQEDYDFVRQEKYRQIGERGTGTVETRWRRKDGSIVPIILSSAPLDESDLERGMTFTALDISGLKHAEEALRSSEIMYRSVMENIQDVYYRTDREGRLLMTSPSGAVMFGYDRAEDMIGIDVQTLWVEPAERPKLLAEIVQCGFVKDYEGPMKRRDGTVFTASLSVHFYRDLAGSILGTEGVIRDVTVRKRAEEALRESEKKFRDLAERLPQAVFEFDTQGRFTYANRFAFELFGYTPEEFEAGVNAVDTVAPRDREKAILNIIRILKGEVESGSEYTSIRRNGEEFPVVIYSTPIHREGEVIGLRGIVIDMTERKRLESQLTQAQKLEAVGTLAGGMAHNFNNILMGIQGHVSMMLMKMNPGHPHFERLKSIEDQIQSGADLTKQLLGFARGGKYEMKSLDINGLLARTAEMFGKTKKEITIDLDQVKGPLTVHADRSQMEQMLMNLLVNAWQSMPGGGKIHLKTRVFFLKSSESLPFEAVPGAYAKISVQDEGTGMDEKTQQRIFEPFFTTKQMGRGTGLGLATVYGIIKGHKGYVTVHSEPDRGTRFDIYLPLSGEETRPQRENAKACVPGWGVVLLVEDEEEVLNATREMLEFLGYRVVAARSGQEALAVYRQKQNEIDLVLMDMIMPGISGGEAVDGLLAVNPAVRIILASGYSLNGMAGYIITRGCRAFIQKPYGLNELSRTLSEVMQTDFCGDA